MMAEPSDVEDCLIAACAIRRDLEVLHRDRDADRVEAFFAPFIDEPRGGPHNLAGAGESIRLCAALVRAQGAATRTFFAGR